MLIQNIFGQTNLIVFRGTFCRNCINRNNITFFTGTHILNNFNNLYANESSPTKTKFFQKINILPKLYKKNPNEQTNKQYLPPPPKKNPGRRSTDMIENTWEHNLWQLIHQLIVQSAASWQRGKTSQNECPAYDTKQFDGEASVMLEL